MEDAVQALMMAFSALVFVIAFTLAMFMFSQVTTTSESLALYADSTMFYDNIEIDEKSSLFSEEDIKKGKTRVVNAETIIPTLYRYADEAFCVKIYNQDGNLIQIFDLDLEGKVQTAIGDTKATAYSTTAEQKMHYAYKQTYNNKEKSGYYLQGVPWLGNKESIKTRIDYFVNGDAGYINNSFVDYRNNEFSNVLKSENIKIQFKERFINYTWSGETITNDDGDILVTGDAPKDKIVIIYTMIEPSGGGGS